MDDLEKSLLLAQRELQIRKARERMLPFMKLMRPDPENPDDALSSSYVETPLARLLCQVIEKVDRGEEKRVCVSVGPQFGKALALDTPIPTPTGWMPIAALQPGDEVYDENGKSCRVVARSEVFRDRPVYAVTSDDGFTVVADAEHQWPVRCSKSHKVVKLKTTKQVAERKARRNVQLRTHGALEGVPCPVPIPPYTLGAWLGDGTSKAAYVCAPGEDGKFIESQIRLDGFETYRISSDEKSVAVKGLWRRLRLNNLLGNKHIPPAYLRASKAQRYALLQGLIDTDGHVDKRGIIEFCNTNRVLAEGVRELVLSLGFKCQMYEGRATLYGKDCGPKYRVYFYAEDAARLPRKLANCRWALKMQHRYLTVEPAGSADTVCIQVDSPSRLYLCGRGMMVTHNSDILSRGGPAWLSGRKPTRHMILGSYNDTFAAEFGGDVREIANSPAYQQVFPKYGFRQGSESKNMLITEKGGKIAFVGVGGSGTGKPADIFFVDDPIKNDEDAQSEVFRERTWTWFNRVAFFRCHNDSAIIVVHTRWHEDDLIGRLVDPTHPERNKRYKGIAARWKYYNLPAVIQDPELAEALDLKLEDPAEKFKDDEDAKRLVFDMFGRQPMVSLWAERKSLPFLAESKTQDPEGFGALYMGQPTPPDGAYFTREDLVEYHSPTDIPQHLRKYAASDHATGEKQRNDYSVLGVFGVDDQDDVWILPDTIVDKFKTDRLVEEMLTLMERHQPLAWWMEEELISKSFGPFLVKRMQDAHIYTTLDGVRPGRNDLEHRARAIQGRMRMRKVHFPSWVPWWETVAKPQLLKFPKATHDDFVSFLAIIGLGLLKQQKARIPKEDNGNVVRIGSLKWIKMASNARRRRDERAKASGGW